MQCVMVQSKQHMHCTQGTCVKFIIHDLMVLSYWTVGSDVVMTEVNTANHAAGHLLSINCACSLYVCTLMNASVNAKCICLIIFLTLIVLNLKFFHTDHSWRGTVWYDSTVWFHTLLLSHRCVRVCIALHCDAPWHTATHRIWCKRTSRLNFQSDRVTSDRMTGSHENSYVIVAVYRPSGCHNSATHRHTFLFWFTVP